MHSWPHAPAHWNFDEGIYMVTAATHYRYPFFATPEQKDVLLQTLFDTATEFGWKLPAWAVLANHYHFIARSPATAVTLPVMVRKLHGVSARALNRLEGIS